MPYERLRKDRSSSESEEDKGNWGKKNHRHAANYEKGGRAEVRIEDLGLRRPAGKAYTMGNFVHKRSCRILAKLIFHARLKGVGGRREP